MTTSLVNQGGTLAPGGRHDGTTVFSSSNYTQKRLGTLEIELGGLEPGSEFDQLLVEGTASLGGRLAVRLGNEFTPTLGNVFKVITAGSIKGTRY